MVWPDFSEEKMEPALSICVFVFVETLSPRSG